MAVAPVDLDAAAFGLFDADLERRDCVGGEALALVGGGLRGVAQYFFGADEADSFVAHGTISLIALRSYRSFRKTMLTARTRVTLLLAMMGLDPV